MTTQYDILQFSSPLEEIQACLRDPVYFINNFVRVRGETITLNRNQLEWVQDTYESQISRYGDERQTGRTTVSTAYSLWKAIFHTNQLVIFVAPNNNMSRYVRELFVDMLNSLPNWMQPDTLENNYRCLKMTNASTVLFQNAGSPGFLRGFSPTLVVHDVVNCFPSESRSALRSTIAALPKSSHIIIG